MAFVLPASVAEGSLQSIYLKLNYLLEQNDEAAVYSLLSSASASGMAVGPIKGGRYLWRVEGTFGGAVVTLQYRSIDQSMWFDMLESDGTIPISMSAPGSNDVNIAEGTVIRAKVAGGSGVSLHSVIGAY